MSYHKRFQRVAGDDGIVTMIDTEMDPKVLEAQEAHDKKAKGKVRRAKARSKGFSQPSEDQIRKAKEEES